jgi:hypothetical protein
MCPNSIGTIQKRFGIALEQTGIEIQSGLLLHRNPNFLFEFWDID